MKDHSSSSSHSRSRSRRYYDKKRSRSRSRERSHRRRSHSPKDRNDKNKTMSEKLKKTIQKQLIDAKTDIKNMIAISDKQSIQPTNDIKIESLSFDDQLKRANEIQDIKSSDFEPKNFISAKTLATLSLTEIPLPSSLNWRENPELVLHPNLFEPNEAKMERWIRKLTALRRKMRKSEKHFESFEELAQT